MLRYYGKFNLFDSSTLIELLERERRGGERIRLLGAGRTLRHGKFMNDDQHRRSLRVIRLESSISI
jgi:hypothetical protein